MHSVGRPLALAAAVLLVACGAAPQRGAPVASVTPSPVAQPAPSVEATAAPSVVPSPTATPRPFSKLRVFVASESKDSLTVLESSGKEYAVVGTIAVGRFPHNISVSPDGRWIAAANRLANSISIVDPYELKELARVRVGKQPHDLLWHPDSTTLFVGHERDGQIARIEAGTWKLLPPLMVGVPQHDLAMAGARPNELFFSVTNSEQWDHLRMYDLASGQITRLKVQDVHDVFFSPDEREIWTTSSGFIEMMSDRLVVSDPIEKVQKQELHFAGRYPFHTMKRFRDGIYFPPAGTPMLLSDHGGPALLFVDTASRRIVGETKLGAQPFHTTYDPIGDRLLVTSNAVDQVSVIDLATRAIVQRITVTAPHGIVAVGIP